MITFDKSDIQRFAVSAVGAITLTAASVFAAAAPVKAAPATLTSAAWQGQVQRQLDAVQDLGRADLSEVRSATLVARFTADGDFAGAALARSSGDNGLDARAVRIANAIDYPALPAGYRGTAQAVTVKLYFGDDAEAVARAQKAQPKVRYAAKGGRTIQFAAR